MSFDVQVDTSALAAGKGPFAAIAGQVAATAQRVDGVTHSALGRWPGRRQRGDQRLL